MASLERITEGGRDCWRLRFYLDKRRQRVGLGSLDESGALEAKHHVEELVECRSRNRPPHRTTTRWLDRLPAEIHDRLAKLELTEPRKVCEMPRTVVAYMRAYIKGRTDWKKPENYRQAVDKLEAFLGRDVPLSSLSPGDADRWHRWMIETLKMSPNTAGQNVKRCRQMMRAAMADRLAEDNPFAGIKIDLRSDATKNRFIDGPTAVALLEACPDQEWRTLFALARYGGLRCPSEVLGLRWTDIAWDRDRFKVRAPKTERYGKGERVVPLWPELLAELNGLFSIVEPGVSCPADAFVIQRYRSTETNLRAALMRIADAAGVEQWAKPFMALRASRRTELERTGRFANHVLNDWFGHSGAVAETHYLQTTEADYAEAAGFVGPSVGPFVGPSQRQVEPPRAAEAQKNPGKTGVMMASDGRAPVAEYTPQDSNL